MGDSRQLRRCLVHRLLITRAGEHRHVLEVSIRVESTATMTTRKGGPVPSYSSEDPEQDRLLEEAISMADKAAYRMKKHLDEKDIMGSLKHASDMISELRTSLLSPKYYFELCMCSIDYDLLFLGLDIVVCGHLRHFLLIVSDYKLFNVTLHELYKLVQHAGNIVPRLYVS